MATKGESRLSNTQIARLAQDVAVCNMESIAMLYLDIDWEELENLKVKHRGNVAAFNRDVIIKWAYKNPSPQQVKVRKNTLCCYTCLLLCPGRGSLCEVVSIQSQVSLSREVCVQGEGVSVQGVSVPGASSTAGRM